MGAGNTAGAIIGSLLAAAVVLYLAYRYYYQRPADQSNSADIEQGQSRLYQGQDLKLDANGETIVNPMFGKGSGESSAKLSSGGGQGGSARDRNSSEGNRDIFEDEEEQTGEVIENVVVEGIVRSGWLKKKSTIGVLLNRWFFIKEGRLFYVHKPSEMVYMSAVKARVVANLTISTVKELSATEFQIISPGQRGSSSGGGVYELNGDNASDVRDWVKAIRDMIESGLIKNLPADSSSSFGNGDAAAAGGRSVSSSARFAPSKDYLLALAEVNPICVDCGASSPDWASLNLGVMICIECSGIHRRLGVHISKVRSLTLDKWTYNNIQLLIRIGNEISNSVWEAELPAKVKPGPTASMDQRQAFISDKYSKKRFVSSLAVEKSAAQKGEYLIRAASEGDLKGCVLALAAGADINFSGISNNKRTALHAACEGGHTLCVDLLCQNNAKIDITDAAGRTPMDIADDRGAVDIMDTLELNGAAKRTGKEDPSSAATATNAAGGTDGGTADIEDAEEIDLL